MSWRYEDQQPERTEIDALMSGLARTGEALTPEQYDALVELLFTARKNSPVLEAARSQSERGQPDLSEKALRSYLQAQEQTHQEIASGAAEILTAQQLQAFLENQAAMREMTRAGMEMARQFFDQPASQ